MLHHALGPVPVHRLSRLPETRRRLVRSSPYRLPLALVVHRLLGHRLGLQVLRLLLLQRVPVGGSLLRLGLGLNLPRKLEWFEVKDILLKLIKRISNRTASSALLRVEGKHPCNCLIEMIAIFFFENSEERVEFVFPKFIGGGFVDIVAVLEGAA